MIDFKTFKNSRFDLFQSSKLDKINTFVGGEVLMSKDSGASKVHRPHAKDYATKTVPTRSWDDIRWVTYEDPGFTN